ncbi:intradiol ring-cleavage dioxygenase [Microbacteriaceae bacterium K1510]|nr:intradiol ring-cleavage dioxygenase [Microbacteriaceae bacterium K1510]
MRNFNENTITDAVLDRIKNTPDPRLKQVFTSLVRHLHDFVRDVRVTDAEWAAAIDFLTRTGQKCDGNRQEFVLLSDTLGVSMLVDAINHGTSGSTETTVLGPFYVPNPPEYPLGADIHGGMKGDPLYVTGRVTSLDGKPLANAVVDVWHSDDDGYYDVQQIEKVGGLSGRARFRTDENGNFRFWTIKPAAYPIPYDGPVGDMLTVQARHPWRPAHVHFMIEAPGYEKIATHVFVDGDQYLDSDAVFGVKDSLIGDFIRHHPGTAPDGTTMDTEYHTLNFDFALAPARPLTT